MILAFLKKHALVIFLFILALSVRTYRLEATLTFLEDEGRDMLIAYRMLDTARPVLLGPQTSTGDMYLGPLYYYFITPALYLSGLSPLGPAMLIAITGALTSVLLYQIGKSWFGKLSGIMSGLMYAILPLPVVFTRNSWNPNLAPLISLLIIYCVIKIIEKPTGNKRIYLYLGGLAGILIQLHYMALLFLGGVGLTLLVTRFHQLKSLLIGASLALISFILVLSPFIVFEVRNDFVNTRAISRFVEADEVHNIRYTMPLTLWVTKVGSTTTRLFSSLYGRDSLTPDSYRIPITIVVSIAILLILIMKARESSSQALYLRTLILLFFIPLGTIGIYQENIHLHYLGFFFPLIYLILSVGFSINKLKYLSYALFLSCLIYSLPQLSSYLSSSGTNQLKRAQEVISYIVKDSQNHPYNLVSGDSTKTSTPYQYFAALSVNPPTNKKQNIVYMVCQGNYCSDSDINSPFIFISGPAHPTLSAYIGHPLYHVYDKPRQVLSNEHVSHGVWVAKLLVE